MWRNQLPHLFCGDQLKRIKKNKTAVNSAVKETHKKKLLRNLVLFTMRVSHLSTYRLHFSIELKGV